jgi:DNA repair protein RadC
MTSKNVCRAVYESIKAEYSAGEKIKIIEPADISGKPQEHFCVITLNTGSEVIKCRVITKGLLNHSLVHPREVFRDAILDSAHSIICVHNHPSSKLEPSEQDIQVTDQLRKSGEILGISVLDHVIVSDAGYMSDDIRDRAYKRQTTSGINIWPRWYQRYCILSSL